MDPSLDTSSWHSSIPQREIRGIQKALRRLRLVDCWRELHIMVKDYTHYSGVHARYLRIYFLFLQHELLAKLQRADIEAATWSDHRSVLMELDTPLSRPKTMSWRLNKSLLMDIVIREQIAQALESYFSVNVTGETSDATIWEADKSARGVSLSN
ncbi:Hypothetical predicted protein [Pelobates cultripes]|uniref:Uncharacterized protein n=1 Tax=Pelobates cultripes TaxID=61616 RepID=A0AAD1TIN5_PELCU|nr:Hypothetical predicted protein [Pelobates cultripes]